MPFDITLSPAQIEFIVKPAATITQTYQITNNSNSTAYLSTSIESWQPVGEEGQINYQNAPPNPHLSFSLTNSDLKLNQTFALGPKSQKQLVLKVKTSADSPLADSYYTLFLSQDLGQSISGKIGSHLLLSTSQTDQFTSFAQINQFSSSPKIKDVFFTPIKLTANLENLSGHFFRTSGQLLISKNNKPFRSYTLFPHNVLAHHSRAISCIDDRSSSAPCSLYPPLWPGVYTATIKLDNPISATPVSLTFFAFPYYLSAILILSVGVFLLLFRLLHHPKT